MTSQPNIPNDLHNCELEHLRAQLRLQVRIELKNQPRIKFMRAIRSWMFANRVSRKIFSDAQDAVNIRLQGLKSQEIANLNNLPKGALIRDHFPVEFLLLYIGVNQIASNLVLKGRNPVEAVEMACEIYLEPDFKPKPAALLENVYAAERRLRKQREKLQTTQKTDFDQLNLF